MRSFYVTKYGFPKTRHLVQLQDDEEEPVDCAACHDAHRNCHMTKGAVVFLHVEGEGKNEIRRVEKMNDEVRPNLLFCVITTEEETKAEIAGNGPAAHVVEARNEMMAINKWIEPITSVIFNDAIPRNKA